MHSRTGRWAIPHGIPDHTNAATPGANSPDHFIEGIAAGLWRFSAGWSPTLFDTRNVGRIFGWRGLGRGWRCSPRIPVEEAEEVPARRTDIGSVVATQTVPHRLQRAIEVEKGGVL